LWIEINILRLITKQTLPMFNTLLKRNTALTQTLKSARSFSK